MSSDVQIESAASLDAATCRRLVLGNEPWKTLGYGEDDVQAVLRSIESSQLLVARIDTRIVGFALWSTGVLLGAYLKLIAVDPDLQSHGVGRRLMEALERHAFAQWPNVYLCVSDFNHSAQRFYQHLGYHEVGRLSDLLVPGKDEILMRKSIGALRRVVS